jgi:hypothetical protein
VTVATMTEKPKTVELVPTEKERDFALAQREATALANSSLVPKEFSGNVANCLIAMNLARRTGFDPLMTMQNLDVIHGRPSFRATFLIACVNACGRFTPLKYRLTGEGDDRTCVAYACDRETGEEIEGPPVTIGMAKAEGWVAKNGSKWKTMPELMLRYRAAAFFARTIAPDVALGMMTSDELEDMNRPRNDGRTARSATEAIEKARDVTPPAVVEPEDESQDSGQEPFDYGDGPEDF